MTSSINLENVNTLIDQVDRKMRTVANKKVEAEKVWIEFKQNSIFVVGIIYLYLFQRKLQIESYNKNKEVDASLQHAFSGSKLVKDDKSKIEELKTVNIELKRINMNLMNEIENFRKENDYLKAEITRLVKIACRAQEDINEVNGSAATDNDAIAVVNDIDLSKYMNSDESDSDESTKSNMPPLEFTIDS